MPVRRSFKWLLLVLWSTKPNFPRIFRVTILFSQKHDQGYGHQRKTNSVDQLQGRLPHNPGHRELHEITSQLTLQK
jgi:hypothetical protein